MIDWPQNNINNEQWQQLSELLKQLEPNQKLWLSGYLAASADITSISNNSNPVAKQSAKSILTILYGSQTGNSEAIANQLKHKADAIGLTAELISLADISIKQLAKKQLITLIISTHGEGEAPDDAAEFYEKLFSKKAPELKNLQYSILALGDSSYELFCQTGKEIDQRLSELGAHSIYDRIDCDVDYEENAGQWIEALLPKIQLEFNTNESDNITTLPVHHNQPQKLASRQHPYAAEILTIQKITGSGSTKNTFHIELATNPDFIQYQPGDSLAVVAKNNKDTVQKLLSFWELKGDEQFEFKQQKTSIRALLTEHVEITQISKPLIKFMAEHLDSIELLKLLKSHQAFTTYCKNHQLLDILSYFDPKRTIKTQTLLHQLRAITPRLYSIASAQSMYEDEVHLTINLEAASELGDYGLASGMLCKTAHVGDLIDVYVEPNPHFKLPENTDTSMILIGPGTGVAPFRAFLQERKEQQAKGENWLVFGNPHFSTDFLYQTEWIKLQQQGLLNEIDLAFSRDQTSKVYVQDKLKQKSAEIWQWLQNGANLYLCGDASQMAKDVEQTLLEIFSVQGKMSTSDAHTHLKKLKRANKYQKDVY